MKKRYFIVLICILVICGMSIFAPKSFSEEEFPEPPPAELIEMLADEGLPGPSPAELIEEMLADEELPEEVKRELKKMLERGEIERIKIEPVEVMPPDEIAPPEEEYRLIIEEEEEIIEEEEEIIEEEEEREAEELEELGLEEPEYTKPEINFVSSPKPNRISLDLKGVDIIDVLKMLSARSDLNIVAGRNVRGRVTLFLKDVDIWDAFEIILAANNLAYVKEGEIINVMTERDYEQLYGEKYYTKKVLRIYKLEYAKAADVSKTLNQAKSKIGKVIVNEGSNTIVLIDSPKALSKMEEMIVELDMPIETKVFSLDYAKAEDIKTKISEILTKGVGTMQVDERTNKLVITDLSKKMPEIANIIGEMDEKHKEVLIETKIIEISLNDQYQYGIDWKMAFEELGEQRLDFNFDILGDFVSGAGDDYATGGALTLAKVASRNLSGVIEALQTVGKTNVLSCPRITVLNNEEAKVLVGRHQPYITTTTTISGDQRYESDTVTYVDVGVELTVTPTINKDGYVTMKIKPKISSAETYLGEDRQAIPIVSTSETETTVMVKDGNTIIIAGLIEDRDIAEEHKIPILGDIPIIGNLFKKKTVGSTDVAEKKELVIFLTPYIVHGTETFPEAENVWYGDTITQRELLEQQMSLAVEDIKRKRSLVREIPPPVEPKDTTTRISEDLGWFKKREKKEKPKKVKEVKLYKEERIPVEKVAIPVEEGAKPVEKVAIPVEEGAKPVEEVVKPVEKVAKPVEEKVAKLVEEKVPEEEVIIPPYLITPSISRYYGYLENVRNRIFWVAKDTYPKDLKGRREDVKILFTLTRDGGLKGDPEVLNGVDEELEKAAKKAVEKAAPFPAFPKRMDKQEESFRITITYQ